MARGQNLGREQDWDDLFALIAGASGWTWQYITETLTVPQMLAYAAGWRTHPPLGLSVHAIAVGLGAMPAPSTSAPREMGDAQSQALCRAMGGALSGRPNDPALDLVGW